MMRKTVKQLLSLALVCALVAAQCATTVFAQVDAGLPIPAAALTTADQPEEPEQPTEEVESVGGEAVELAGEEITPAAEEVASGNCGPTGSESTVTWSLDDAGLLTIAGTGAMGFFGTNSQPWALYLGSIYTVKPLHGQD